MDIGAHFGYFSLYAYKSSTTDTQIYAFEPSSKNFNILKNNIKNVHAQQVTPVNKAVTATDEIVKLSLFNHQNNSIFSDYISTEKWITMRYKVSFDQHF
ncbi:MAG: FkbM family methyltransferase [Saprospiraceae bacterium]|nr:FkbM family methyltransferase [Saprospiraceae bacterium]